MGAVAQWRVRHVEPCEPSLQKGFEFVPTTAGQEPLHDNRPNVRLHDPYAVPPAWQQPDMPDHHPLVQRLLQSVPAKRVERREVAKHPGLSRDSSNKNLCLGYQTKGALATSRRWSPL